MRNQPRNDWVIRPDLTDDELNNFRNTGLVAIDTETTGLNPHRDALSLVQLADSAGNVSFVKTRDWGQAHNLRQLLIDPSVLKIFHFALFDCAILFQHLGVETRPTYCTKIASKLIRTYSSEHGLATLVWELLGHKLDKSQQSTDWFRDDLSESQLAYAANDVLYLMQLKQQLDEKISRRGMLPTGVSYVDLNAQCQAFLPTLVQLWLNGWDFGSNDRNAIFSH